MSAFIHDPRGCGNAQSDQVRKLLGLAPTAKLPTEGMHPRFIQGIEVWVAPLPERPPEESHHKRSTHSHARRVRAWASEEAMTHLRECSYCEESTDQATIINYRIAHLGDEVYLHHSCVGSWLALNPGKGLIRADEVDVGDFPNRKVGA